MILQREPQAISKSEFLDEQLGLNGRFEWVRGVVGPMPDQTKLALLVNWGVEDIVRITGPDIWRDFLAELNTKC